MWYMDCYCWGACLGREFPVNSYYSESAEELAAAAGRVLASGVSGVDEVRIGRETKGQTPQPLTEPRS